MFITKPILLYTVESLKFTWHLIPPLVYPGVFVCHALTLIPLRTMTILQDEINKFKNLTCTHFRISQFG